MVRTRRRTRSRRVPCSRSAASECSQVVTRRRGRGLLPDQLKHWRLHSCHVGSISTLEQSSWMQCAGGRSDDAEICVAGGSCRCGGVR